MNPFSIFCTIVFGLENATSSPPYALESTLLAMVLSLNTTTADEEDNIMVTVRANAEQLIIITLTLDASDT
jgi:hypothetical protein